MSWSGFVDQPIEEVSVDIHHKAEIITASEGTKELIWLKRWLSKMLESELTPTFYIDNASSLKLARNPEYH